jgi:hypothetical protein
MAFLSLFNDPWGRFDEIQNQLQEIPGATQEIVSSRNVSSPVIVFGCHTMVDVREGGMEGGSQVSSWLSLQIAQSYVFTGRARRDPFIF